MVPRCQGSLINLLARGRRLRANDCFLPYAAYSGKGWMHDRSKQRDLSVQYQYKVTYM